MPGRPRRGAAWPSRSGSRRSHRPGGPDWWSDRPEHRGTGSRRSARPARRHPDRRCPRRRRSGSPRSRCRGTRVRPPPGNRRRGGEADGGSGRGPGRGAGRGSGCRPAHPAGPSPSSARERPPALHDVHVELERRIGRGAEAKTVWIDLTSLDGSAVAPARIDWARSWPPKTTEPSPKGRLAPVQVPSPVGTRVNTARSSSSAVMVRCLQEDRPSGRRSRAYRWPEWPVGGPLGARRTSLATVARARGLTRRPGRGAGRPLGQEPTDMTATAASVRQAGKHAPPPSRGGPGRGVPGGAA